MIRQLSINQLYSYHVVDNI